MPPKATVLSESIDAVTKNGKSLLDDAKLLRDWDRPSTAFALAVLAQEEFAKAFLLQLVQDEALPLLQEVRRSIRLHQCKHLLAVVMGWVPPTDWNGALQRMNERQARHEHWMAWARRRLDRYSQGLFQPFPDDPEPTEPDVSFPPDVEDALTIYCSEKIKRLRRDRAERVESRGSGKSREIADGLLDKKKQCAFYVDIEEDGRVGLHPGLVTPEEASEAIGLAEKLAEGPDTFSAEYDALKRELALIFPNLPEEPVESA